MQDQPIQALSNMEVLPVEIVCEILKHIAERPGAVFRCVQVSRKWCLLAMPILWQCDLWASKEHNPLETMLACLPFSEQSRLHIATPEKCPLFKGRGKSRDQR